MCVVVSVCVIELPVADEVAVVTVVVIVMVVPVWLVVSVFVLVAVMVSDELVWVVVWEVAVKVMVVLVVVMQQGSAQTVPQEPTPAKVAHSKPALAKVSQVPTPIHAVVQVSLGHPSGFSTCADTPIPRAKRGHTRRDAMG